MQSPGRLRPMGEADVAAVARLQRDAFHDLEVRMRGRGEWSDDLERLYPRIRHLIRTDPAGAWVAEVDGEIRGAALALVREGLWGLSLLVIDPEHQSAGLGRALFRAALDYGAGADRGIIIGSEDPRALRAYIRAGFDLRPVMDARGPVRNRPPVQPGVREGRWSQDREIVDAAGRFVRGAGHGLDVPAWLEAGGRLLVHEDGGFAVRIGGAVKVVAAREPPVAAALLRAALREVPHGAEARVEFMAAGQEWAVAAVLDAGLDLQTSGAVMTRGRVGPLAPYLPSGAYL